MMKLTLGQKIIVLRKKKKVSRNDFAAYLGITPANITNYENDRYRPTYEVLIKISDYFGVSLDFLLREITLLETEQKPIEE